MALHRGPRARQHGSSGRRAGGQPRRPGARGRHRRRGTLTRLPHARAQPVARRAATATRPAIGQPLPAGDGCARRRRRLLRRRADRRPNHVDRGRCAGQGRRSRHADEPCPAHPPRWCTGRTANRPRSSRNSTPRCSTDRRSSCTPGKDPVLRFVTAVVASIDQTTDGLQCASGPRRPATAGRRARRRHVRARRAQGRLARRVRGPGLRGSARRPHGRRHAHPLHRRRDRTTRHRAARSPSDISACWFATVAMSSTPRPRHSSSRTPCTSSRPTRSATTSRSSSRAWSREPRLAAAKAARRRLRRLGAAAGAGGVPRR